VRQRLPATMKGVPLTVIVFTALSLVLNALDWILDPYLSRYPVWNGVWNLLFLGVLAAIVVWRQRWAWWLCLLSPLAYVVSPAWGARFHPIWYVIELVFIGLLLTPSMRAYVRGVRPRRREPRHMRRWVPWLACLFVAGAVELPIAIDPRHPYHSALAYRVIGFVVFWLALAGALRLAVAIVQVFTRLLRRRRGQDTAGH